MLLNLCVEVDDSFNEIAASNVHKVGKKNIRFGHFSGSPCSRLLLLNPIHQFLVDLLGASVLNARIESRNDETSVWRENALSNVSLLRTSHHQPFVEKLLQVACVGRIRPRSRPVVGSEEAVNRVLLIAVNNQDLLAIEARIVQRQAAETHSSLIKLWLEKAQQTINQLLMVNRTKVIEMLKVEHHKLAGMLLEKQKDLRERIPDFLAVQAVHKVEILISWIRRDSQVEISKMMSCFALVAS